MAAATAQDGSEQQAPLNYLVKIWYPALPMDICSCPDLCGGALVGMVEDIYVGFFYGDCSWTAQVRRSQAALSPFDVV